MFIISKFHIWNRITSPWVFQPGIFPASANCTSVNALNKRSKTRGSGLKKLNEGFIIISSRVKLIHLFEALPHLFSCHLNTNKCPIRALAYQWRERPNEEYQWKATLLTRVTHTPEIKSVTRDARHSTKEGNTSTPPRYSLSF